MKFSLLLASAASATGKYQILIRPPQDVPAVLNFDIPCFRPETSGFQVQDDQDVYGALFIIMNFHGVELTQYFQNSAENVSKIIQDVISMEPNTWPLH